MAIECDHKEYVYSFCDDYVDINPFILDGRIWF